MSVSKRTRFEVFKRDGFRCLYCGRTPPEVLLHCDHVIASANGGSDDPCNLFTACQDCNLGKSDVPLSQIPYAHKQSVEERQEAIDQLRAISQLSIEAREQENELVEIISGHWIKLQGSDPDKLLVSKDQEKMIRKFLKHLPVGEIIDAINITANNVDIQSWAANRYFCGVCWKKIKEPEKHVSGFATTKKFSPNPTTSPHPPNSPSPSDTSST